MRKVGRPKKPENQKVQFDKLSVHKSTRQLIVKEAKKANMPIYAWVDRAVNNYARR